MNTTPGFPDPVAPQPPVGGQPLPPQGLSPTGAFGTPLAPSSPGQPNWMPQSSAPAPAPQPQQGSSKVAYVLLGVAVVIVLGLVAFFVTRVGDNKEVSGDPTVPSVTIPQVTIPDITVPEITIPQITVPGVTTAPTVVVPTQPNPPVTVAVPTDLLISDQLPGVIAQIATARGAAPLRILSANLYGEYVILQVQDPTAPANVDQYMWRDGAVGAPDPVTLTGDGDLEANLFSDTEVNWAVIPGLVAQALAQIPIEGATVTHINIERNLPFSADIKIRVFVDGTRGSGFLDADAQGTVISVNQG